MRGGAAGEVYAGTLTTEEGEEVSVAFKLSLRPVRQTSMHFTHAVAIFHACVGYGEGCLRTF